MRARFIQLVLLAALASWILPPALAAIPDAEVEAVLAPAWLVRDGRRLPLGVGKELGNGDQILIGDAARARLWLADGSTVKLGENSRFTLDGMAQKHDGTRRFTAVRIVGLLTEANAVVLAVRLRVQLGLQDCERVTELMAV